MGGVNELIRKIETSPFNTEVEAENILSQYHRFEGRFGKKASVMWGHSIENHVRRIITNYEGAELIFNGHPIFEHIEPQQYYGKLYDNFYSKSNNGRRLIYKTYTEGMHIETKNKGLGEIDLLFKIDNNIIFSEIKYIRKNSSRYNKRKKSPINPKNFTRKLQALTDFFDTSLEYWAITNYESANQIKTEGIPAEYSQFIESGHKLISVKVDEDVREEFHKLLFKKDHDVIFDI